MKTEDKLREYFADVKLKNLNNKACYKCFDDNSYGAVSLNYLSKYLFKGKVTDKFISKKLFKLIKEKIILPIPCDFANNLVFTTTKYAKNKLFCRFNYDDNGIILSLYYKNSEKWKERINLFNSYL